MRRALHRDMKGSCFSKIILHEGPRGVSPLRDSASLILLGSIPLSKVNSEPRCLSKGAADTELHPHPRAQAESLGSQL